MATIFISYNRQSKDITKTLVDDIKALGHTVWFDKELSGGQVWWDQILASARKCDVFVFILDPKSLNSTACKREYGYAADLGKPILPVLVAEGVSMNLLPPALSKIQFVDYRKQDREAVMLLSRALSMVPPPKPLPDPLPTPPEVPISYLGSLTEKVETVNTLTYEEQSVLLVDLKRSLRNTETAEDAIVLLKKLRNRRDLLATIAREIDELFSGRKKVAADKPKNQDIHLKEPLAQAPASVGRDQKSTRPSTVQSSPSDAGHKTPLHKRLKGALFGAILGITVGWIVFGAYGGSNQDLLIFVLTSGTAWGIAGAITGTHWHLIIASIIGSIIGLTINYNMAYLMAALIIGMPIGAILGAIAGVILKKLFTWE